MQEVLPLSLALIIKQGAAMRRAGCGHQLKILRKLKISKAFKKIPFQKYIFHFSQTLKNLIDTY